MTDISTLVIPTVVLLALGGLVFHAGVLTGRFNKHESTSDGRLKDLEKINSSRITREEMEGRLKGIERELSEISNQLRQALRTRSPE